MERVAVSLSRPGVFLGFGPVRVTEGGDLFYCFDRPGGFKFTLPVGRYVVEGARYVGPFKAPRALTFGRTSKRIPRRIRVVFAPNPNKCSIHLRRGLIVCDPSLRELPRVCLTFILFHEIGHFYWNNARTPDEAEAHERACDAFAAAEMLRAGWNPSQVAFAIDETLSPHSQGRKDERWEDLKNTPHVK